MKSIKNSVLFLTAVLVASFACASSVKAATSLTEPVKSALDNYVAIQETLAKDSIKGISEHAAAIAKAVRDDSAKSLSPTVATQAEALGKATDLKAARAAFRPLSNSMIKYLADTKAGKGVYHEAYCPMVKAGWVQKGTDIKNPYAGKEMLDCGEIKN